MYKDVENQRRAWREYYHRHKNSKVFKEKKKRQRAKIREVIDNLKDVPCADCGGHFPPECMDFDHVRGKKRYNVGSMTGISAIFREAKKCDIICANCHRIRTKARGRC